MKNESLSKNMNKLLAAACEADAILMNGQKHLLGLSYNTEYYDAPIVCFKTSNKFRDYFFKIAQTMRIPCLENKLLATALFDEIDEGDCISEKYFVPVTRIYSEIAEKMEQVDSSNFDKKLSQNILSQFCGDARHVCKRAERRFLKKPPFAQKKYLTDKDTLEYIEKYLVAFAQKYELDIRISDNTFGERNFFIDSSLFWDIQKSNPSFSFWQMLTVSLLDRKIYVASLGRFRAFDIDNAFFALDYYIAVFDYCGEELVDDIKKHSIEFSITFKSYNLAQDMAKTMLELNHKKEGIEYSFNSDTTVMTIYLQKTDGTEKEKKYMVVITYNAFLRDPTAFKDFIANPRPKNTWNFWCRKTCCR